MSTTSECYLFSFPWALAVILVNIKTVKVADDGILIELQIQPLFYVDF